MAAQEKPLDRQLDPSQSLEAGSSDARKKADDRVLEIIFLPAYDGVKIKVGIWRKPSAASSRFAFFLNGRSEWIEKYNYVYRDLELADDLTLVTLDHRGQGGSEGVRGHIESFVQYAQDLKVVRERLFNGGQPEWVMAHSMGALIALYSFVHGFIHTRFFFLLSPLLGLPDDSPINRHAREIATLASNLGLSRLSPGLASHASREFEGNGLTSDRHRFEALSKGPFPVAPATFGWIRAAIEAMNAVREPANLSLFEGEVYIFVPGEDPVVSKRATLKFQADLETYSDANVVVRPFDQGRHELLSETHRIYGKLIRYINARIPDVVV